MARESPDNLSQDAEGLPALQRGGGARTGPLADYEALVGRGVDALELPRDPSARQYKRGLRLGPRLVWGRMPPSWPETIGFGRARASLENGQKTGVGQGENAKGFGPLLNRAP